MKYLKFMNRTLRNIGFSLVFFLATPSWGIPYNLGMFWRSVDTTPPVCSISTAISGWRSFATEVINFSCTSAFPISIQCNVNSGGWSACSTGTSHTISGITSGSSTTFQVRAVDSYGLISSGQTRTWSTDYTAPVVTLGSILGTSAGAPNISFSGTDVGSGIVSYSCSLDTGTAAWGACSSPFTGVSGAPGVTYYFRVSATDGVGLVSTTVSTSWVNGNWGGWGGCSVGCGGGTQTRACNNPSPSASPAGMACSGAGSQTCNTNPCCTAANSTTNMCAGQQYYMFWQSTANQSCVCPGSIGGASGDFVLYTDASFSVSAAGISVSCASGSAATSGACPFDGKTYYSGQITCTCN